MKIRGHKNSVGLLMGGQTKVVTEFIYDAQNVKHPKSQPLATAVDTVGILIY